MTSHLELSARAALCRQLARREPDSKNLWLAEADRWSRLTHEAGLTEAERHREPAGSWRRHVMPRSKPRDAEMTAETADVRYELRTAGGRDMFLFEEFLGGGAEPGQSH
jgi:hypothetical protein